MARLEADGEFAEQLFVHGLGVQTAEGLAEWLHWRVREMLGIDAAQGRRYSWGYPAVPEQSEHLKVEELLRPRADRHDASPTASRPTPSSRRSRSSPTTRRRSTSARRQGRLLPDGSPDDLIRGSARDPSLFGELDDAEPEDGGVEGEDEPAMAGESSR